MTAQNCSCRKCGFVFKPEGRFVATCPRCHAKGWSYPPEGEAIAIDSIIEDVNQRHNLASFTW